MTLRELEAEFVRITSPTSFRRVEALPADGVLFLCPCGGDGGHSVLAWFRHVPPDVSPGPGRWDVAGTGLDDLTLTPSIALPCAHFFVRNGAIA